MIGPEMYPEACRGRPEGNSKLAFEQCPAAKQPSQQVTQSTNTGRGRVTTKYPLTLDALKIAGYAVLARKCANATSCFMLYTKSVPIVTHCLVYVQSTLRRI